MTMLHLGMAAIVPLGGDDSDIKIKRWVLKLLLPIVIGAFGWGYVLADNRWKALETAPSSNEQVHALGARVTRIEKVIDMYEELRSQRDKQISALEANQKAMEHTLDRIDSKIDRLLLNRMRTQ